MNVLVTVGPGHAQPEHSQPDAQAPESEEPQQAEDEQAEDEQAEDEQAEDEQAEDEQRPEQAKDGEEPASEEDELEQSDPEQVDAVGSDDPEQAEAEPPDTSGEAPANTASPPPPGQETRLGESVSIEPGARPNRFDRGAARRWDPRELALDTSNTIYVPEVVEPAPDVDDGQDEAASRTQARTLGRVTVLSNVLNTPADETLPIASEPRPPSPETEPRNDPAAINVNRLVSTSTSIEAQQLPLRAGRSASPSAQDSWTWLWGLAGTALVLLLPIVLLLTRPTRRG